MELKEHLKTRSCKLLIRHFAMGVLFPAIFYPVLFVSYMYAFEHVVTHLTQVPRGLVGFTFCISAAATCIASFITFLNHMMSRWFIIESLMKWERDHGF